MPAIDYSRFPRYAELVAQLQAFATEYPQLVELQTIGRSHEGREIWVATLTNRATGAAADKPASWVDGNIHSVEVSASLACLHFIETLLTGWGTDPEITRALDTRAFYVCPRVNPDGAEWALADSPRYVRSGTRRYPFDEDVTEGLLAQDIDGDGRILQMRVPDPNGPWKKHPEAPALMIRRDPIDPPGGDYYRVISEGLIENYDGVNIELVGINGTQQGLDLNRNFPANWRQEHQQLGAGPFPTSEPEVRAVVEFFASHPNIGNGTSVHTFSGVLLRPFGSLPDDKMPAEDLWTYQTVGKKGEALTGYPAISVYHEFQYMPGEFISGSFDWIYEHLGCFTWTIEIWNPKKEAGIDNRDFIHWFRDHPPEDDLKVYRWAQEVAPGAGHLDWKPFDHPQLGRVEVGGWNRFELFTNPPPARRAAEVARFSRWLLWQSLILPRLEVSEARAERIGADTWRVRLVVANSGWLPSYVTKMALKNKQSRGLMASIELPAGASLVAGKPRLELGELEGWAYTHTGISFWQAKKPTAERALAEWIVQGAAGDEIALEAWHERAGRVSASVKLD